MESALQSGCVSGEEEEEVQLSGTEAVLNN